MYMDIPEENRLVGIATSDWCHIVCGAHRSHVIDPIYANYSTSDLAVKMPSELYHLCYWMKFFHPMEWMVIGDKAFEGLKCELCGVTLVQSRDYSTLNMDFIRALPEYVKPPTYEIEQKYCYEYDVPPGHPKNFLFDVLDKNGGWPRVGRTQVIQDDLGLFHLIYRKNRVVQFKPMWNKLPLDHPRVQAWINFQMYFYRNSYISSDVKTPVALQRIHVWYPEFTPTDIQLEKPVPSEGWQRGDIGALTVIRKTRFHDKDES